MRRSKVRPAERGFTIVELLIACVVFPIIVAGVSVAATSLSNIYRKARQLNEIYEVISACPEVDRALEFDSVSSSANCYPNNSFKTEDSSNGTISYTPTLTVTKTSSLSASDPLQTVYDSKVIDISVGYPGNASAAPIKLRLLITRNGIGQL